MSAPPRSFINVETMFAGVHPEWTAILKSDAMLPDLITALESLDPNDISPKTADIFAWAKYGPPSAITAVIIGQDPFPNPAHAHGLCFSSRDKAVPESTKAIFDCLAESKYLDPADVARATAAGGMPGYLATWASQGVLMINTALTTKPGIAKVHVALWEGLMKKIIALVGALDQPIAFLLWGGHAKAMRKAIKSPPGRALVLEETHPSPLGQASLPPERKFRFCTHFRATNEFLINNGRRPIDWNPFARHIVYTDGSANGHGPSSKAGYAAYFIAGPLIGTKLWGRIAAAIVGERPVIHPTNIRGEGFAIVHALEHIIAADSAGPNERPPAVEVVTDSEFWINMIKTFIPKWIRESRPFTAQENPDLVERIWAAASTLGKRLTFRHIYSHGKDKNIAPIDARYNDLCDVWAKAGRDSATFHDTTVVHTADLL